MKKSWKMPNELVVQMDGRNWADLTKEEKISEIEWCLERVYCIYDEASEDQDKERLKYLRKEIKDLKTMLFVLKEM